MIDLAQKGMSKGELDSVHEGCRRTGQPARPEKQRVMRRLPTSPTTRDKEGKAARDGTLMKTPIVRNGRQATVGYQPDVWEQWE